jgi:hypothetical protein
MLHVLMTNLCCTLCVLRGCSEEEAYQIRMQSHMFTLYPPRSADMWASNTPALPQQTDARWAPTPSTNGYPAYFMSGQQQQQQQHGPPMPCATATSTMAYQPMPEAEYLHHHQQQQQLHHNSSSASSAASSSPSSSPPSGLSPLSPYGVQTQDKLKLMLKRKLQGPCRPAKIPKLVWDENCDGGLDYAVTGDPMHSPDSAHYALAATASNMGSYSWHVGPMAQMVGVAQYRNAMMPEVVAKAAFMPQPVPAYPGALSPPLSAKSLSNLSEQVVPDSVSVPESYLTPDPSPASSPQPHTSMPAATIKTEVSEPAKASPTSAAILQELEKLASLTRAQNAAANAALPQVIKSENLPPACQQKPARKELPVMNAFDIESFFDTLTDADLPGRKMEAPSGRMPQPGADSKMVSQAAMPVIKQEPVDAEPQMPHAAVQPQAAIKPQPPAKASIKGDKPQMNQLAMEELLNFFAGDLTATQLDLSDSLVPKDDADMLIESARSLGDRSVPCSMGHFVSGWDRSMEDFSPSSGSDMSGDEDGSCSSDSFRGTLAQAGKQEDRRSSPFAPSPHSLAPPQTPQDVPGICQEDELYQLDKLLSAMANDSGESKHMVFFLLISLRISNNIIL